MLCYHFLRIKNVKGKGKRRERISTLGGQKSPSSPPNPKKNPKQNKTRGMPKNKWYPANRRYNISPQLKLIWSAQPTTSLKKENLPSSGYITLSQDSVSAKRRLVIYQKLSKLSVKRMEKAICLYNDVLNRGNQWLEVLCLAHHSLNLALHCC